MVLPITFRGQMVLGIALLLEAFALAALTEEWLFVTIGWCLYGLLFLVNPLWPKKFRNQNPKTMKLVVRIAGVIFIAIGILFRFTV